MPAVGRAGGERSIVPPTPDEAPPWYALATRSRYEAVVRQQLAQKNIEAFLPIVTRWSRWSDRWKQIESPLFPGYCFARFDACDRLAVLQCVGVMRVVSFGGQPAPVPEFEVNNLRLIVGRELERCTPTSDGMLVEVVRGPLRGVVGRLLRRDTNRATVVLSVDLIGQGVRVEVDPADIKPRAAAEPMPLFSRASRG